MQLELMQLQAELLAEPPTRRAEPYPAPPQPTAPLAFPSLAALFGPGASAPPPAAALGPPPPAPAVVGSPRCQGLYGKRV